MSSQTSTRSSSNTGLSISPAQLVEEARALKGIPWRHQGRTPRGLDCIGLIVLSMRRTGLDLPTLIGLRDAAYSRHASGELIEKVERHLQPAPAQGEGVLAVFKFYGERHPRHFGLITKEGHVIHCNAKHGGVMEHGLRAQWARWLHSIWLLPGVDYGA